MTYELKPEDLDTVTDVEVAFGTVKLLPEREDIPQYDHRDFYERFVSAMFYGGTHPAGTLVMREGFEGRSQQMGKAVAAHLKSFEPKHERKIEGVAYMLSLATKLVFE